MAKRFVSVLLFIMFAAGMFKLWNWIGSHFADAPAQAVWGMSPTFVGMVLFFLMAFGILFILAIINWIITGE